jgi:hypothetical protein
MTWLLLALWLVLQPAAPPLAAAWVNDRAPTSALVITVGMPGCLRLIGNNLLDTELPDSCGKATYTIAPDSLNQDYDPHGRTIVLRDEQGIDRAMLPVPPHYRYAALLPLVPDRVPVQVYRVILPIIAK